MLRPIVFSCILLLLQYAHCSEVLNDDNYKDVRIEKGTVRGFQEPEKNYYAFLGIPYAAPPVGTRRFKAPIPPPTWKNVLIANRTVMCPQRGIGEENCLIANVFTPTKILNSPLPVLVYIHGGSFLIGSAPTRGVEHLIKQHVIVVTINYRLGALGFLCLGIENAPGNAGLKDQVAALKWVNRNIDKFGGDPKQVTIYGMSAGGTSVEMLIISRMAKGLFNRAIVESGAASAVWSLDTDPIKTAKTLAKTFDIPKNSSKWYRWVEEYQMKPANELSESNYELYQNLTDGTFGFVPCLEKKLFGLDSFLSHTPNELVKQGKYNNVPILFIFASLEGLFLRSSDYYELNYKERMNDSFKDFMPADLIFDSEEIRKDVTENVKLFYFGDKPVGDTTLKGYLDYFGDNLVLHGLLNSAIEHSKRNDHIYLMEFAYKGELGSNDTVFDDMKNAGHGDAVKYAILNKQAANDKDKLIVNRMTKIVANFMKYADPNPSRSELMPILWPALQPDNVVYLQMDEDLKVLEEPFWERKLFWDNLYNTYRQPVTPDPDRLWF